MVNLSRSNRKQGIPGLYAREKGEEMSRKVKYICDGCGKEIEKNPIRLQAEHVDAETGDFSMGAKGYYWENGKKDYCEDCMAQIIHFVDGLPAKNTGKVTVAKPRF